MTAANFRTFTTRCVRKRRTRTFLPENARQRRPIRPVRRRVGLQICGAAETCEGVVSRFGISRRSDCGYPSCRVLTHRAPKPHCPAGIIIGEAPLSEGPRPPTVRHRASHGGGRRCPAATAGVPRAGRGAMRHRAGPLMYHASLCNPN
jgi:hypothetical protein